MDFFHLFSFLGFLPDLVFHLFPLPFLLLWTGFLLLFHGASILLLQNISFSLLGLRLAFIIFLFGHLELVCLDESEFPFLFAVDLEGMSVVALV